MIRYLLPVALTLVLAHPSFACGTHQQGEACDPKACESVSTDTHVGTAHTAPTATAPQAAHAETKTLTIAGMACAGCANKLSKALTANPAITSASVDFEKGLATITFVKDQITEGEITQLIEKLGFKADTAKAS